MDIIAKSFLIIKSTTYIFIFIFINSCTSQHMGTNKFNTLINTLNSQYVKDINISEITDSAIQKVFTSLDSHSRYLSSKEVENYLILTKGEYGGIGISMSLRESILTIVHIYPDSPAQKAGIKTGDIILKIDEHSTLGLSLDKCSALAKGKVGKILNLLIIRKFEKKPFLFKIKRKKIETSPIKSRIFEKDILYVKLSTFDNKSAKGLKYVLDSNTDLKGLILDLRSNTGGILQQAVSIVDMFISKGLIVKCKGRNKKHNSSHFASKSTNDIKTKMVVLIDSYSASASEIVAGALKFHKRATIIGDKSFGKGSVQALFSLNDDTAAKLTVAKYYLPDGKCIDEVGIKPDIFVKSKHSVIKKKYAVSQKELEQILKKIDAGEIKPKKLKSTQNKNVKIKLDKAIRKAIRVLKN